MLVVLLAIGLQLEPPSVMRSPPTPDPYARCVCEAQAGEVFAFTGTASDARVALAPDGLSTLDRQATIFTVARSAAPGGVLEIWHSTDPARCGLTFDYGRLYTVRAIVVDGRYETSWCLDPRREAP